MGLKDYNGARDDNVGGTSEYDTSGVGDTRGDENSGVGDTRRDDIGGASDVDRAIIGFDDKGVMGNDNGALTCCMMTLVP